MSNDRTRRPSDPWKAAEAAFKPAAPKPSAPVVKRPTIPGAKETISLRIDKDVLEHFQNEGAGWQDRINDVLRQASGLGGDGGKKPAELNAENDG